MSESSKSRNNSTVGISQTQLSADIRQGDICLVSDVELNPTIKFPSDNLPNNTRTYHGKRYVLILQSNKSNEDKKLKSVLTVPLSHSGGNTSYTVVISKSFFDAVDSDSVALLNIAQSIHKTLIGDKIGHVPPNCQTFQDIRAIYLKLIGII